MRRRTLAAAVAAAFLAVPAAASAHVTLNPKEAAAGAYTVLDVRVPNERDNALTTKVEMQMPPGVAAVSYQSVPGWTVEVTKGKLAKPIQTDDGPITEGVSTMTWTADDKDAAIAPGQFADFPIQMQIPGQAGDVLTFKALQTYSNGEIVRWIGSPDADEPAPTVTVTAATGDDSASHASAPTTAPAPADDDDSGSSDTLAIVALIVGALGLLAGLGAVLTTRRRGPAGA
jgi:uncharacterized protein YcnI